MKRFTLSLLAGSLLLFAASCGNGSDEKTQDVDTMTTAPTMETTPSGTQSGDMMGTDSMANGASNTNDNTGRSMSTGTDAESGARNGRGNATGQRGSGATGASGNQTAPVDPEAESTYPRAQPGAPVDGRMPVGTSK